MSRQLVLVPSSLLLVLPVVLGALGCPGPAQDKPDAGPGTEDAGPFHMADHPKAPQVTASGQGAVLATPTVVPIFFQDDPFQEDVTKYLPEMQQSGYWKTVTSEYGVGDLNVGTPIVLDTPAPGSISTDGIVTALSAKLTSADPNTIYMFVIPLQTTFGDDQQGFCCSSYGGFHSVASIKGQTVPVAFTCTCQGPPPGVQGFPSSLDELAVTVSHELVEAATDPDTQSGFNTVDDDHVAYGFLGGGELGDMCEFLDHSEIDLPGLHLPVQRIWSNKSAKSDQDPCIPAPQGEVFFASVPALNDTLQFPDFHGGTFKTKGAKIAVGETKTIDVQLYSQGPIDDWGVQVLDASNFFGGPPSLKLDVHDNHGTNGDVIPVDVTVLNGSGFGGEIFLVLSTFDKYETMAVGLVGQR